MRWLGITWLIAIFALDAQAQTDPAWKSAYLLSRAGDAYAKGKKKEAEQLFRTIIASDPTNEVALLHLAAMARARGSRAEQLEFLRTAAAAHPQSYPVQHELGANLLDTGHPAEAIEPLQASLTANPKSLDAAINLGDAYSALGKLEDAHRAYATGVGIDGSSAWARRQFGYCLMREKRPSEALAELERASRTMATDSALFLNIGHLQNQLGNDQSALAAYLQVTRLAPRSSAGFMFAGTIFEKQGRRAEAERAYRSAIAANVLDPLPHIYFGNLRQAVGDLPTARAQYEAALASASDNAWALTQLGFLLVRVGENTRAEKLLTRALALDPHNLDIEVTLGDLERLRNRLDAAAAHYKRVLNTDFANLGATIKLGDVTRLQGDMAGALGLYRKATGIAPKSAWAWISLADAESATDDAQAEAHYRNALAADPHSLWATRQLGYWLFAHDRLPEAREHLVAARSGYAQDGNIVLVLGHIARREHPDTLQLAADLYQQAITLDVKNARPRMFLADVERALGHLDKALALFQQAVAIDPKLLDAWVLLGDAAQTDAEHTSGPAAAASHALAQQAYERALALDPQSSWPARQLGFLAFGDKRFSEAAALLDKALVGYPKDREIYLALGHMARTAQDFAGAIVQYQHAVALVTDGDIRALVFLGVAQRENGELAASRASLQRATELAPGSAWALGERAQTEFALGDINAATASVRLALVEAPTDREALLFLARLRHLRRAFDEAITLYQRVLALYPGYASAELGLATALGDRGTPVDLLAASRFFLAAMEKLPTTIFTELVAGHLYTHIAVFEQTGVSMAGYFKLPADKALDTHAIALAHLQAALTLAHDDDSVRLSAANSFVSLRERARAEAALAPIIASDQCPKSECDLSWHITHPAQSLAASSPTEAGAASTAHLHASAELLRGDLDQDVKQSARARLRYACAIALEPSLVSAHLRLALAYENEAFVRFAEEHYLVALSLEPDNSPARLGVERLRKQSGFPVAPAVRLAGDVTYRSDALPPEILARNALILGVAAADLALTVPRQVSATATGDFVISQNRKVPHVEAEVELFQDTGNFLSDQLQIESRYGGAATARVVGTAPLAFRDSEISYAAQETITAADASTRSEVRTLTEASARWTKFQLGILAGDIGYEHGFYQPQSGALLVNADSNALFGDVNFYPELRRYKLEPVLSYHGEGVWLAPTHRSSWDQSFLAGTDYRLPLPTRGQAIFGGSIRIGAAAGTLLPPNSGTLLSYMVRVHGAYAIGTWLLLDIHVDVQGTPHLSRYDAVIVGGDAGYRLALPIVPGITHTGFYFSAGYAARIDYNAARVDHLITGSVSFAR